jgi:hypothetical protein
MIVIQNISNERWARQSRSGSSGVAPKKYFIAAAERNGFTNSERFRAHPILQESICSRAVMIFS